MTQAPPAPDAPRAPSFDRARLLPWLAALIALCPDLAAVWPSGTYFFRDFSVTFYPLRVFAARELADGRWPVWNPYISEGSFVLPVLYPPDLLHALWPSPVAVSWLLTLHLPLAALAAYWLARQLGSGRAGAFVAAVVYALGGLALSSLNLYVFLQALALAPLVVGTLRRAAGVGKRAIVMAAAMLALALSTLAIEFVAQAVLLGIALGLAARPRLDAVVRLALAGLLGAGLAGIPVALTLGITGESVRGGGFGPDVALANAVHPLVLLQVLVPDLFGALAAPVNAWWGGRFFSKGLPYFLSLYLGPLALALAWAGAGAGEVRDRLAAVNVRVLLGAGLVGLWYALGSWGGLAPVLAQLPFLESVRFPSKALLLPHMAVALLAARGADRLRLNQAWGRAMLAGAVAGALGVALAIGVGTSGDGLAAWASIDPARFGPIRAFVARGFLASGALGLFVVFVGWAVRRGRAGAGLGTAVIAAALAADLVRAGAGMNPQAPPSFFAPLPEMAGLHLSELEGARVFSYGLDHSPAFREFLAQEHPLPSLASFFVNRQILSPYSNVVDGVEAPEATDLTSFVPRPRELGPEDYDPQRVSSLVPWLRNAVVSRVLSLDPLVDPDLVPMVVVPLGPPGLAVHVYRVARPWPRAFVACRAVVATDRDDALGRPYQPAFDPEHEVAIERAWTADRPTTCQAGRVERLAAPPDQERFRVEIQGSGYLVSRASFARGWTAWVDGSPAPVLRANGKHRAVLVPAGAHEVRLRYEPPGLWAGIVATVGAALGALAVWVSDRKEPT